MSTRTLARLILSSSKHCLHRNVTLPTIALRYYRECHFETEQIVTQSRRLVVFSVSKSLKLTQFDRFTSLFYFKKSNFAMGKRTRSTKNETLGFKYLLFGSAYIITISKKSGKCRHFSMRLLLRTQGKLVLANFRLKIRPV